MGRIEPWATLLDQAATRGWVYQLLAENAAGYAVQIKPGPGFLYGFTGLLTTPGGPLAFYDGTDLSGRLLFENGGTQTGRADLFFKFSKGLYMTVAASGVPQRYLVLYV